MLRVGAGMPRVLRLVSAAVLPFLAVLPCRGETPGGSWDACRDRTLSRLEAEGERDFGDPSAYLGASGAGASEAIIEACGYRPESLGRLDCDSLFEQVYPACRRDGLDGMSLSAASWIGMYDPQGVLMERLRVVCAARRWLDRNEFGSRVCPGV